MVVVTHIDGDHISGIIRLLEEMPIGIGDVWYNGYRHIQSVAVTTEEKKRLFIEISAKSVKLRNQNPLAQNKGVPYQHL